jgi:hypothetical protein
MAEEAEDAFDDIRLDFAAEAGVSEGRMFRTEGLTYRGKFFVALRHDAETMLVKLPEARVTELLADGSGLPFTTGDRGPMREWALIPLSGVDRWSAIAAEAFAFAKANAGPIGDDADDGDGDIDADGDTDDDEGSRS